MTDQRQAFDAALEHLKDFLPQYLTSLGYDTRKQFRCINPEHSDKTPSCGVIKNYPKLGHCFGCGVTFDIFTVASWLEGKPNSGRGWVTETVMYLAEKFGVELPTIELSEEDLRELQIFTAYSHACQIIRYMKEEDLSAAVHDKLKEYGWSKDVLYKMGIGSVKSYDEYLTRMKQYGHTFEFLKSVDLANRNIFNENNLVYTIRDINGSPVGFSARDLHFEKKQAQYEADLAAGKDENKLFKPRKYYHTKEEGTLFVKAKTLFNLDLAKKAKGALLLFEGNADCATAYAGGLLTSTALLGTAFTLEMLDLIIDAGKKHIVVVLDGDKAGKKATARIMAMVEQCKNHVGLRVEVMEMPEGAKDPDQFIRTSGQGDLARGVQIFRKLDRTDLFTWQLQQALDQGEDPIVICEKTMPLIVNERSNLIRMEMADRLAKVTNTDREFVRREVMRLIDDEKSRVDEELNAIANDAAAALRKNPKALQDILARTQHQVEVVEQRSIGFNVQNIVKSAQAVFEQHKKNNTRYELVTGNALFDETLRGIPRHGVLLSHPGKPHHGKSIWFDNLVNGLLDHNKNLTVILHTVDDPAIARIPRILGARFGVSSEYFYEAGWFLGEGKHEAPPNFEQIHAAAEEWYMKVTSEMRLICVDTSDLAGDLAALKSWIKTIRDMQPDRDILVFGDNFHLYDLQTEETGEQKVRAMSRFANEIMTSLGVTMLFTMEIPKEQLKPGVRPAYTNLKGSGGLSFDAKVNVNIYNQLQDLGDDAVLYWQDPQYMEKVIDATGIEQMVMKKLPIVEVIIDKNKHNGNKRTIFYRLEPKSGRMVECSEKEQFTLRDRLLASEKQREADKELARSRAPYRRSL